MTKKKVYYDKDADVLYFLLEEGRQYDSDEVLPGVTLELGKKGEVMGIEILNASKILKDILKIKNSSKKESTLFSTL